MDDGGPAGAQWIDTFLIRRCGVAPFSRWQGAKRARPTGIRPQGEVQRFSLAVRLERCGRGVERISGDRGGLPVVVWTARSAGLSAGFFRPPRFIFKASSILGIFLTHNLLLRKSIIYNKKKTNNKYQTNIGNAVL